MATRQIDLRLRHALDGRHFVRVVRRRRWDELSGYVVAIGAKWVLIALTDERIRPDGFIAVRRRDIVDVRRRRGSEKLHRAALERHGNWPPARPPSGLGLDRTRDLVAGLGDAYELLVLHTERENAQVCFIGLRARSGRKWVDLQEISPNAEWATKRTRYGFGEISRIDVGDGYTEVLLEIAGPPHRR